MDLYSLPDSTLRQCLDAVNTLHHIGGNALRESARSHEDLLHAVYTELLPVNSLAAEGLDGLANQILVMEEEITARVSMEVNCESIFSMD